jgi:WhiB family transcriptional regulator, redox-sensing transcriptional regulator
MVYGCKGQIETEEAGMPAADFTGQPPAAAAGQNWQDLALCQQTDPEAFHPDKGGSTRPAKRICQRCEVKAECLDYALRNNERFGIWGGLSEQERRQLQRRID